MSRPLPLHVTLGLLTSEARERLAAEWLALGVLRDAASKAARDGLNMVTIPFGAVPLRKTKAAKVMETTLKGIDFEWVEGVTREGEPQFALRLIWQPSERNEQPRGDSDDRIQRDV